MATTNEALILATQNGFVRLTQLLKQVETQANTTTGKLSDLTTTTKVSLVDALNEVKALVGTGSGGTSINDDNTALTTTWSSTKIRAEIDAAVTLLLGGADTDNDSLKELADKIAAIAQADAGLLSLSVYQEFTPEQQAQGRANLGLGELSTKNTEIDDTQTTTTLTWSSTKINTTMDEKIAAISADNLTTTANFVQVIDNTWASAAA